MIQLFSSFMQDPEGKPLSRGRIRNFRTPSAIDLSPDRVEIPSILPGICAIEYGLTGNAPVAYDGWHQAISFGPGESLTSATALVNGSVE